MAVGERLGLGPRVQKLVVEEVDHELVLVTILNLLMEDNNVLDLQVKLKGVEPTPALVS